VFLKIYLLNVIHTKVICMKYELLFTDVYGAVMWTISLLALWSHTGAERS
jgi:hypothetical protein